MCDCQDDGLQVQVQRASPLGASTAQVMVVLRFAKARPVEIHRLALVL